MARFLILIQLILLSTELFGQSGKYQIKMIDTREAEGTVLITPYSITIDVDSSTTVLPVTNVTTHRATHYYILEGCYGGVAFRGAGMLSKSSDTRMWGFTRHYSALYIEIRARQQYVATRFSIYYDE